MNELNLIKKEFGIFDKNGNFFVDSKHVAKIFKKRHDNVLQSIDNLLKNESCKDFNDLNFKVTFLKNKSGRQDKIYNITKDGEFAVFTKEQMSLPDDIELVIYYVKVSRISILKNCVEG